MRRTRQATSRHQELRLNCPASGNYVDPFGLIWVPDNTFIGTGITVYNQPNATNTVYPTLFNSLRYNSGGFTYNLAMDNGLYTLQFFWSETHFTAPGQKIFGLAIQGQTVLQGFDLIRESGGQNIAVTRTFKAFVTNRNLRIDFLPGSADHPSISAICISRT